VATKKASWHFDQGAEIVPGRLALKSLGGGYSYEAYLTWDERLFAIVVCKIVRPDRVDDEGTLRDLKREADLVARLAHPVIVRGFGAVFDGPHPHLVLEHLEGPNLKALLKQGSLPLEQLLPLMLHICSALHYLSVEEVVHLDVKPSNIVMGVPPRLIDMSVARSTERAKRITGRVGTTDYMAPEQCLPGELGQISPATDVWGLGVTLYQAITKRLPFTEGTGRAEDDIAVRYPQVVEEPIPVPNDVPRAIVEPVMSCLAKDPADRPTASELALAFEPLVAALPRRPVLGRRRPRLR
jgi:serine/threonine protein kinase